MNQPKLPAKTYRSRKVFDGLEKLWESQTIAGAWDAFTIIALGCGELVINDTTYKKYYYLGPHGNEKFDKYAPEFNNLGFQHTLRGDVLTSLLLKTDGKGFLQFVHTPEDGEVKAYDSVALNYATFKMSESVHNPYFDILRLKLTRQLLANTAITSNGLMIQSS